MAKYTLEFTKKVSKKFAKIDKSEAARILKWLEKNIDGCENPRAHGKPLKGKYQEFWRYRVGKYRVLCKIEDSRLVVLALEVDVRGSVY
ncbi:type II toxin-antitoxin system RelE family toxin [Staphylococcus simulans]